MHHARPPAHVRAACPQKKVHYIEVLKGQTTVHPMSASHLRVSGLKAPETHPRDSKHTFKKRELDRKVKSMLD